MSKEEMNRMIDGFQNTKEGVATSKVVKETSAKFADSNTVAGHRYQQRSMREVRDPSFIIWSCEI